MGYSGVLLACLDERDPWLSHVIYHTTVWSRLASATTPSVALDLPRSTTSGLCRLKARTKFEHTYRPIAHMWGSWTVPPGFIWQRSVRCTAFLHTVLFVKGECSPLRQYFSCSKKRSDT